MNRLPINDGSASGYESRSNGRRYQNWASHPILRTLFEGVAIDTIDRSISRITQPRGILRDHIQHRLDIRRRAGDDAQNLARRGLLLQRFGELAVASIELVEQPDVLDGDDGLAGECLKKFDLFIGKRTHFGAAD